jgi:hypothetical protein
LKHRAFSPAISASGYDNSERQSRQGEIAGEGQDEGVFAVIPADQDGHEEATEAGPSPDPIRYGSRDVRAAELDTAPKTPPCIFTILTAAAWLPASVAPQQSSSNTHSKPRSLASRIVV